MSMTMPFAMDDDVFALEDQHHASSAEDLFQFEDSLFPLMNSVHCAQAQAAATTTDAASSTPTTATTAAAATHMGRQQEDNQGQYHACM